jgi:uncharacterized protein (TIGR02594 family)
MPSALLAAIPPHLVTMRAITGTKEVAGAGDNPTILGWAREIGRRYPELAAYAATFKHDSIPWCGYGLGYVMAVNGIRPVDEFMWAANWAHFGVALKEPAPGAVFVFKREGGNHVTLYESEDRDHWFCRGCNQSDGANVSRRSKAQAPFAIRWPKELPLPTTGRVFGATPNFIQAGRES